MTSFECHEDLEFENFSGVDKRAEMEGTNDYRHSDRISPAFGYIHHRSTPTMEAGRCVPSFILYLLLANFDAYMLRNVPAIFRSAHATFEPAIPAATVSIRGFFRRNSAGHSLFIRVLSLILMFFSNVSLKCFL
jgi:hypothetical protein